MNQKEKKRLLLEKLYEPYKKCLSCPLGFLGRQKIVFGQGNPDAKLMIIGEAPGKNEDEQGEPFVGRSGKLLTKVLTSLGIERKNIFITNIVKCRPPLNRKPTPLEGNTCKSLLLINQIKIIQPKVICTLGTTPIEFLLEKKHVKISEIHGKSLYFDSIIIIPTYHPAYILRTQKLLPSFIHDISTAYSFCK